MKTAKDPRHQKRRKAVKALFAESFTQQKALPEEVKKILAEVDEIDKKIENSAPAWPVKKLNKIDLAILRLAVYELEKTKTPPKVVIDEAVELAKEYGSDNSPSFVNGVLGTIYKKANKMTKTKNRTRSEDAKDTAELIKKLLADHIGVEPEDINNSDSFAQDLHMSSSDLSDFLGILEERGIDTSTFDLPALETVNNLIESISSIEPIE